jgi:hypothetical protein
VPGPQLDHGLLVAATSTGDELGLGDGSVVSHAALSALIERSWLVDNICELSFGQYL